MNSYRVIYLRSTSEHRALTRWISRDDAVKAAKEFHNCGVPQDELAMEDKGGNVLSWYGEKL